jgi:GNAT superfamily N-acetyltransferase
VSDIEFRVTAFDAPESAELIEEVQGEYVVRYGGRDETAVDPAEFVPPQGVFIVGWDGDLPVACGGVRITGPGLAELKRVFVRAAARRRGIARQLLDRLENEARSLGAARLRLETGIRQPEAIAMYESAGYTDTDPFGHYADEPLSRHLAKVL